MLKTLILIGRADVVCPEQRQRESEISSCVLCPAQLPVPEKLLLPLLAEH